MKIQNSNLIFAALISLFQPTIVSALDNAQGNASISELNNTWYSVKVREENAEMQSIANFKFDPSREPWMHEDYKNCISSKAKLYNEDTAKVVTGTNNIVALLACPGNNDGGAVSIVALFERTNLDKPICFNRIQIMDKKQDRYYWWGTVGNIDVRRQRDDTLFVAVSLGGADAGDFWGSSAFLQVDKRCGLTLLSKFYGSGHIDDEGTCEGIKISHEFVGNSTVRIEKNAVSCAKTGKGIRPKPKHISTTIIDLGSLLHNLKLRKFEP